ARFAAAFRALLRSIAIRTARKPRAAGASVTIKISGTGEENRTRVRVGRCAPVLAQLLGVDAGAAIQPTLETDSAEVGPRHLRFLLFAWVVSWVDVIDRPRPNTMDLKDGLFFGPGEMVHLGLHNRDAAGWYCLGLGGIKLVSHADVKGAGDHSDML